MMMINRQVVCKRPSHTTCWSTPRRTLTRRNPIRRVRTLTSANTAFIIVPTVVEILVSDDKPDETGNESIECPVCLGPAVFPVRIPCGHVFCFLCVKGAARQANRCPMCRQLIPVDFDKNPDVLERQESEMLDDGYQWFYEGKNGTYCVNTCAPPTFPPKIGTNCTAQPHNLSTFYPCISI